ncbi:unnamed protein product [Thelazia callipaeda]|uniref:Succinate dehydrogenase assembly factor 3 n=1 Tax=Thelazia callipaeda TaxID=103827 RepID=A0A0N5D7Y0_THECL|nr:unnamed protein product [Thelazia callipaeda]
MAETSKKLAKVEHFQLILYKRILRKEYFGTFRLHYGLPSEMRAIGDQYVKDEFRRHKNISQDQALIFLKGWTVLYFTQDYCTTLSKQLSCKNISSGTIGAKLDPTLLDCLQHDQLLQLYRLKVETQKFNKNS